MTDQNDIQSMRDGNSVPRSDNALPAVRPDEPERKIPSGGIGFADSAQKRRERIQKLEARLQRERARDTVATRRERNGQLYVWGAMIEGVYRTGNEQERRQIREWARRQLTDARHLQRAEYGFARIDDEKTEKVSTLPNGQS